MAKALYPRRSVAASLSIEAMNFITLKMPVGADGKVSVDAKLRHDLNCELALITAVSVVTTLLRRTRLSS